MTDVHVSGWCIHGHAYGPNWACDQCAPCPPSNVPGTTVTWVVWTPERVERLMFVLERILDELKDARLRR